MDGLRFGYDRSGREVSRAIGARAVIRQRFDVRDRLIEQVVATTTPATTAPATTDPASATRAGATTSSGSSAGGVVAGRRWTYRADTYVSVIDDVVAGRVGFGVDGEGRILGADNTPDPTASPMTAATTAVARGGGVAERFSYTPAGLLDSVSGGLPAVGVASSPVAGPAALGGDRRVSRRGTLITRIGRDRYVCRWQIAELIEGASPCRTT